MNNLQCNGLSSSDPFVLDLTYAYAQALVIFLSNPKESHLCRYNRYAWEFSL
jgi:hypothetical protein